MSFSRGLKDRAAKVWEDGYNHPFVQGLGAGTLEREEQQARQAEVDAARELNMRGLLTLKNVLLLHYQAIEEKYGRSFEDVDLITVAQHLKELRRDLSFGQLDSGLMSSIPGFINLDSEEDRLMMHRNNYYYSTLTTFIPSLGTFVGGVSTEECRGLQRVSLLSVADFAEARDVVLQRPGLRQNARWDR